MLYGGNAYDGNAQDREHSRAGAANGRSRLNSVVSAPVSSHAACASAPWSVNASAPGLHPSILFSSSDQNGGGPRISHPMGHVKNWPSD